MKAEIVTGLDTTSLPDPKESVSDSLAVEFARRYQQYHEARAALDRSATDGLARPNDKDQEKEMGRVLDELCDSQWALIVTPPALGYQMVQKIEVLEEFISDGERDGWPHDKRHLMMAAAVKSDIYDFDLERRKL